MLLVVLGAGASYDSLPSYPTGMDHGLKGRPPLANMLFADTQIAKPILERYHQCHEIVPYLRPLDGRQSLEDVLERLQSESDTFLKRRSQLAAVRFYLLNLIWDCESVWLTEGSGITNHRTLLDQIAHRSGGSQQTILVTFNYDRLLEHALGLAGHGIKTFEDYADRERPYSLFKLHGSINWVRTIEKHPAWDTSVHELQDSALINLYAELVISDEYHMVEERSIRLRGNQYGFPALSIPVNKKSTFECPRAHLERLDQLLPRVDRILTIGWRANEWPFLKLLSNGLQGRHPKIQIVTGRGDSAGVYDNMVKAGVMGPVQVFEEGFSNYIRSNASADLFGP